LACASAISTQAVLVNLLVNHWPDLTDWHFADCRHLERPFEGNAS